MTIPVKHFLCGAALALLWGCGSGGGSSDSAANNTTPVAGFTDGTLYSSAPGASLASAQEVSAVTHKQITLNGTVLNYTATAGHLTARNPTTNAAEASFFYVAYTLDNAVATTRPVTFFYNGGPGSATVWLHLGSYGPKRLAANAPSTSTPTPFPLVDNAESLLDMSDLVFVDAIGSGFSEAIAPNTNQSFWGVDADAAAFRDFVMRYVAANSRNGSPKFIFGESYGTTRSAVLANLLESAGMSLKGVVLLSSVLNYNANCGVIIGIVNCAGYLPTYSAVGAWYSLTNPVPAPGALPAFVDQARTLATTQYSPAVLRFLNQGAAPTQPLLSQLVAATGMPQANWQSRFNLDPNYFQYNLVAGSLIGRYDARMSAPFGSPLTSEGDPSSTFITPSFQSTITSYLSTSLQFTTPSNYTLSSNAINTWDFGHDGRPLPDTIPDLAAAMAHNPSLKVLSLNGYHDLATPFFITENDLARLGGNANVQVKFYNGGHMIYLDDNSRQLQKADLRAFYQAALAAP